MKNPFVAGLCKWTCLVVVSVISGTAPTHAQITKIINIPDDQPNIGDDSFAEAGTQVNLYDGGEIGADFVAKSGSEVNINGGQVGSSEGFHNIGIGVAGNVNLNAGRVFHGINVHDGGRLAVNGGEVYSIDTFLGSTTNVNGGEVLGFIHVHNQANVNIAGGEIGPIRSRAVRVDSGGVLNITGGSIGGFDASTGSNVTISGGTFGHDFDVESGLGVTLVGGEFVKNRISVNFDSIKIGGNGGDIFTGTFADGTPFIFAYRDSFGDEGVRLSHVLPPPIDLNPMVVNSTLAPLGLRKGQTLALQENGVLATNFASVGATLDVVGGSIGDGLEVVRSTVNISGGEIGEDFQAYAGSTVNVSGGTVGSGFYALPGSVINVTGGTIGGLRTDEFSNVTVSGGTFTQGFEAFAGSVKITGGELGYRFRAFERSNVSISGGNFGSGFTAEYNHQVTLLGSEFRINRELASVTSGTIRPGDIVTGTLFDGSVFILTSFTDNISGNNFNSLNPTETVLSPANLTTMIVNDANGPKGLRAGQSVDLQSGGELGRHFAAVSARIELNGGSINDNLETAWSTVNLNQGTIGEGANFFKGSVVNMSGGSIGRNLRIFDGSQLNISGGEIGDGFQVEDGSSLIVTGGRIGNNFLTLNDTVSISGGEIGQDFEVRGEKLTISGGTVGANFLISSDSEVDISGGTFESLIAKGVLNFSGGIVTDEVVIMNGIVNLSGGTFSENAFIDDWGTFNVIGSNFMLDGLDISDRLVMGEAVEIDERNVVFAGVLADGRGFRFELGDSLGSQPFIIERNGTISATLVAAAVPEPGSFIVLMLFVVCRTLKRGRHHR